MSRPTVILILATGPRNELRARFDEQIREIKENLGLEFRPDRFKVVTELAVRVKDLQKCLNDQVNKPDIVHITSFGSPNGDIIFEDEKGYSKRVSPVALRDVFKTFKGNIRLVVLNACHSLDQARAIAKHIDCVVGMATWIDVEAAIFFAADFYKALGKGGDVKAALDAGRTRIRSEGVRGHTTPRLVRRKGVDPGKIFFCTPVDRAAPEYTADLTNRPLGPVFQININTVTIAPGADLSLVSGLASQQIAILQAISKPKFKDLFDVIVDGSKIPAALFRTDRHAGLAAFDVDYVEQRQDPTSVQKSIHKTLMSRSKLLLSGRSGIGKTREVAEFAKTMCTEGWTICIAKHDEQGDANKRLDRLIHFPSELSDERLLLIFDDLHRRTEKHFDQVAAYEKRLESLIAFLEENAADFLIIAMAPSEPKFHNLLEFDPSHLPTRPPWNRFASYELPEFDASGLEQMLIAMAAKAKLPIDETIVPLLIKDSDRKPATLLANVNLALATEEPLREVWKNARGQTWKNIFVRTEAKFPAIKFVYRALALLQETGLPSHSSYVHQISKALGGRSMNAAVNALVDAGLLGRRKDLIAVFNIDHVNETLKDFSSGAPKFEDQYEVVINAIQNAKKHPTEWLDHLVALSSKLLDAELFQRADDLATTIIRQAPDNSKAYAVRALSRFHRLQWESSEEDLTAAIKYGLDDVNIHNLLGIVRGNLGNFDGMVAELSIGIDQGSGEVETYFLRGWGYFNLQQPNLAEKDFAAGIERKPDTWYLYPLRAEVLEKQKKFAAAENDITHVLRLGVDMNFLQTIQGYTNEVRKDGLREEKEERSGSKLTKNDAILLYLKRSHLRIIQCNYTGAEEDLTIALESGVQAVAEAGVAIQNSTLGLLTKIKKTLPDDLKIETLESQVYYSRAISLYNQGRYNETTEDMEEALRCVTKPVDFYSLHESSVIANHKFGNAHIHSGIPRDSAEFYFGRGIARISTGQLEEAVEDLNVALTLNSNEASWYALRGALYFQRGMRTESQKDLTAAIDGGHSNSSIYFLRGVIFQSLGKYPAALSDFDQAIAQGADEPEIYNCRGFAFFDQGLYTQAEEEFELALKRREDNFGNVMRTFARLRSGKIQQQSEEIDSVTALNLTNPDHYLQRAQLYLELQRFEGAEKDINLAMDMGIDNVRAYFMRSVARLNQGKFSEAEQDADRAIAAGQQTPVVYFNRGQARFYQQNVEGALADYDEAIKGGLENVDVLSARAKVLKEMRQHTKAEADATAAIKLGDQRAYAMRANLRLKQNNLAGAEEDYDAMLKIDPDNPQLLYTRAWTRFYRGNLNGASDDLNKAAENGKTDEEFYSLRVVLDVYLNKIENAEQAARSSQLSPDDPVLHQLWGLIHLARLKYQDALASFQRAFEATGDLNIRMDMGTTLLLIGQFNKARNNYKRAISEVEPVQRNVGRQAFRYWISRHAADLKSPQAQRAVLAIEKLFESAIPVHEKAEGEGHDRR